MIRHARTLAADPSFCILPDGRRKPTSAAEALGFTVFDEERQRAIRVTAEDRVADRHATPADRAAARADLDRLDREDYAHAIRSLPEAEHRPAAAGRVIAAHNARSMPPAAAAMFLRNLPLESAAPAAPPATAPRHAEPPAVPLKRKAELAMAAANARAAKGDTEARRRADAIGKALTIHAERGVDLARALEVHGLRPQSL